MDTKEIMQAWGTSVALMRKPKLTEACDVIADLCLEVGRLKKESDYQKQRQDTKEAHYKTMIVELHNVVSKYS